jgi:hypothetical protein
MVTRTSSPCKAACSLSAVQPQVPRQVALLAETTVAVRAVIRLLPRVHSKVCRQAALVA